MARTAENERSSTGNNSPEQPPHIPKNTGSTLNSNYPLFVVLLAVICSGWYWNYSNITRMEVIYDAVTDACYSTDQIQLRSCLKTILSKCDSVPAKEVHTTHDSVPAKEVLKRVTDTLNQKLDISIHQLLEDRVEQLEKRSKSHSIDAERFKNLSDETSTTLSELHQNILTINTKLEKLTDETASIKPWRTDVEVNITKLGEDLKELTLKSNTVQQRMDDTDTTLDNVKANANDLSKKHDNVTGWADVLEKNIDRVNSDHENVTRWIVVSETNTTNWIARFEGNTSTRLDGLEDFVELNKHQTRETYNELSKTIKYQPLLLVLVLLAFIWMIALTLCMRQWSAGTGVGEITAYSYDTQPRINLQSHQQIQAYNFQQSPSQTAVCVIGFHSETERGHLRRVQDISSTIPRSPGVMGYTVHRHDDIRTIPVAKVYVMFVDFNERNVILEDPRKGLGDIKLLTVKQLWGYGGDVILVYSGDVDSGKLEGNELFNRDLTSIYNHKELTELKNQQRMLSIHKNFNPCQTNHIKQVISEKCH